MTRKNSTADAFQSLFRFSRFAILAAVLSLSYEEVARSQDALDDVRDYRHKISANLLRDYAEFLKYPNVSADSVNVRRAAEYLVSQFQQRGLSAKLLEVSGANPVVYGRINAPGATKTIVLYAHYDGQAVDESKWRSTTPWLPTIYSDSLENHGVKIDWADLPSLIGDDFRIYARSSADDKAPIFACLVALDALKAANARLTSNVIFFIDGEEEAGSHHLGEFLHKYESLYRGADAWLFCDGPLHQSRNPTLYFGVRGVVNLEITAYGANRDLHSGHYGNWAPNPAFQLCRLLASMKDDRGNVLVKHFHDSISPVSDEEVWALSQVPATDSELLIELGFVAGEMEGESLYKSVLLPSLNIQGIVSGDVGARSKNIVPNIATAALDIRLVKGNEPSVMLDLVENHIAEQGFHIIRTDPTENERQQFAKLIKVKRGSGYPAARTSMQLPIAITLEKAICRASNSNTIVKIPTMGGSLPLYPIVNVLGAPIIIVPVVNHDNNQHGPDENLRVGNLWYAIDTMAAILTM